MDPRKANEYGGCGILVQNKIKKDSVLDKALYNLMHIPCRIFNKWAGTTNVHARDYGIDCCLQEDKMEEIFNSIDESTMSVRYGDLKPKGIVAPGHLSGSYRGICSDLSSWMCPNT